MEIQNYILIGEFKLYLYGLFVTLGVISFLVMYFLSLFLKRVKIGPLSAFLFLIINGGVFYVGAYLFDHVAHVISGEDWIQGGISFLGGFVPLFPSVALTSKLLFKTKQARHTIFEALAPGLALGHSLGRIGCFFAGCCYGIPSSFSFFYYPEGSASALRYGYQTTLFPTQLVESFFLLVLFITLFFFIKKHRVEIYFVLYGAVRFTLEFFRGDDRGSILPFISPSQLLSIALILSGVVLLLKHDRESKKGILYEYSDSLELDIERKWREEITRY